MVSSECVCEISEQNPPKSFIIAYQICPFWVWTKRHFVCPIKCKWAAAPPPFRRGRSLYTSFRDSSNNKTHQSGVIGQSNQNCW